VTSTDDPPESSSESGHEKPYEFDFTERIGVDLVSLAVRQQLRWMFRGQETSDFGIDAQFEIVQPGQVMPNGELIAVQIKAGASYLRGGADSDEWTFYIDDKHLKYWLEHVLPVIVVLVDVDTGTSYWQAVTWETIESTPTQYALRVPKANILDATAIDGLTSMARRTIGPFDHSLSLLPSGVQTLLKSAETSDTRGARWLADLLAQGRNNAGLTAESIINGRPATITRSADPQQLWMAVGEYALSHDFHLLAGEAYLLAADVGADNSARCRAIGGILVRREDEVERSRRELERAREEGATLLAATGLAMLKHPTNSALSLPIPPELAAASESEIDSELLLIMHLGQYHEANGDSDRALEYYERAIRRAPEAHGVKLAIVRVLARHIAERGGGSGVELARAKRLANEALQDMRRWSGPSEIALRFILQFKLGRTESTQVIADASVAPFGTALAREAADSQVALAGALASLHLGRDVDRERFVEALCDHPRRRMFDGWQAMMRGDETAAVAAWSEALETLDDDVARSQCISVLTRLGQWPADAANDLRERGVIPDAMFEILHASSLVQSDFAGAIQKLRELAVDNHLGAIALVQALQTSGNGDAITECQFQMVRWGDEALPVICADLLREEGRDEEAKDLVQSLLGRDGISEDVKRRFKQWLIHYHGVRSEWPLVEQLAAELVGSDPSDEVAGWNYLIALANQRKLPKAQETLARLKLVPTDYDEIRLWVQLHFGISWPEESLGIAIDIAQNTDDKQLAVMLVSLASREIAIAERQYGAEILGTVRRVADDVGVDPRLARSYADFEQLDALLVESLRPDAATAGRVTVSVRRGEVPLGRLSSTLHIPYSQALIQRAAGITVVSSPDDLGVEVNAARRALGAQWAVELSALYVSNLLGPLGARLRSMAGRLLSVEAAAEDALRGRDVVRVETSAAMAMRYNAHTDSFVRVDVAPDDAAKLRRRASDLENVVQQCLLQREISSLPAVGYFDNAWAAAIDLARNRALPLYSDDVALRRMARAQGIETFGTHALLTVARDGTVGVDEYQMALKTLASEYVVDLPVGLDAMVELAISEQWQTLSAWEIIGRPAWWISHDQDDLAKLLSASGDPGVFVPWTKQAMAGAVSKVARLDEQADIVLEAIGAGALAAFECGASNLHYQVSELLAGTPYGIPNGRLRLMAKLSEHLEGRVGDPFATAAELIGGATVL
jgi:tetratricopeptide (TPR) repeat protein